MAKKRKSRGGDGDLFIEDSGQLRLVDKSAEQQALEKGKVECLGMTFDSEDARRVYFTDRLREKLADPEFRKTPGIPKGTDEDIIRMSDPPWYTACPNPFLHESPSIFSNEKDADSILQTDPFAADVSEGKHDPVYKAHTYHTKVPPKAIAHFLRHYTSDGDVILDPFCGSGMTGVAGWMLGGRTVIQADLSPAATHIAAGYTRLWDIDRFSATTLGILKAAFESHAAAFTIFDRGRTGTIKYWVWTDVLVCNECAREYRFSDAAVNLSEERIDSKFECPHCGAAQSKANASYAHTSFFDPLLKKTITQNKREPFWVVYEISGKRIKRALSPEEAQQGMEPPSSNSVFSFPVVPFMHREGAWGCLHRAGYHFGITHAHHFYTWRVLSALQTIWRLIEDADADLRHQLRFWFMATANKCSKLMNYNVDGIGRVMKGSLYISSLTQEVSPFHFLEITRRDMVRAMATLPPNSPNVFTSTSSASAIPLADSCVDYAFVDPPFGKNLIYSELNFLWECWLRVFTDETSETIVNEQFGKTVQSYTDGMAAGFAEIYRVLRPGRWLTVEFHNSQNAIWIALQQALERAGFIVADVRILDKKHGSIKQVQTQGAVKQDLAISAYRPVQDLEGAVKIAQGSDEAAWMFVREHLLHVPRVLEVDGALEVIAERTKHRLFDRMVAFHVQRGMGVPLSAANFYLGLEQRFIERDEMFFLSDQAAEYDQYRARAPGVRQLTLFVTDEESAINWIRQHLSKKPQTFQDLQPLFVRELHAWARHEKSIELTTLLEENFLRYDGVGPIPTQIHAYLSSNYKDLRNLTKTEPDLVARASGRWFVPDPNRQSDLDRLRERGLLREFTEYRESTVRKIKHFRTEAVRAGFKSSFQKQDYKTIVSVAAKLPENVLQEDVKLLMYYDVASMRLGDE